CHTFQYDSPPPRCLVLYSRVSKFVKVLTDGASNPVPPIVNPAVNELAGHRGFEEGNGLSAGDSSGSGNDGQVADGPGWLDGIAALALGFDGQDDLVEVESNQ
ncbi:MAG TPA: hypothetical protein VFA32_18370, partial [Dehalococcoidia bacterium]|nr:hypothetical protein [Dehalococcoidia bacterium]